MYARARDGGFSIKNSKYKSPEILKGGTTQRKEQSWQGGEGQ